MGLTKSQVDRATYEGDGKSRHVIWDDRVSGFGLRVYPTGRRSFVVFYRVDGKQRLMVLGQYGVLTVDQARKRAQEVLAEAAQGQDPVKRRSRARRRTPFACPTPRTANRVECR